MQAETREQQIVCNGGRLKWSVCAVGVPTPPPLIDKQLAVVLRLNVVKLHWPSVSGGFKCCKK